MLTSNAQAPGNKSWKSGLTLLILALVVAVALLFITVLALLFPDLLGTVGMALVGLGGLSIGGIGVFVLLYNFYKILRDDFGAI